MGTVRPLPHQCKRSAQRVGGDSTASPDVRVEGPAACSRPVSLARAPAGPGPAGSCCSATRSAPGCPGRCPRGSASGATARAIAHSESPSSTVTLQRRHHHRRCDPLGQRGLRREPSDCPQRCHEEQRQDHRGTHHPAAPGQVPDCRGQLEASAPPLNCSVGRHGASRRTGVRSNTCPVVARGIRHSQDRIEHMFELGLGCRYRPCMAALVAATTTGSRGGLTSPTERSRQEVRHGHDPRAA